MTVGRRREAVTYIVIPIYNNAAHLPRQAAFPLTQNNHLINQTNNMK